MKLTKYEMETIVSFNEAESTAEVYTYNIKLKNRLKKLSEKYPEEFRLIRQDDTGAVTYCIPKRLIGIRAPVDEKLKQQLRANAIKHGLGQKAKAKAPVREQNSAQVG